VRPRVYSSMEALLAHWHALRSAAISTEEPITLTADEKALLEAMEAACATLDPVERAALEAIDGTGTGDHALGAENACRRRRQRALAKLSPLLVDAGWLQ
jgi:hypothetical protein